MRGRHASILICLGAAGCASYEARPLEPEAHREAWDSRHLERGPVAELSRELALGFSGPAGEYDPSDGLSLAEAEAAALVFHPHLRLARLRFERARVDAEHAGAATDPELSLDVQRIAESVPDPWVITPGLAFTVPLSGRRSAERAQAEAGQRAAVQALLEEEWTVLLELRREWLGYSAAHWRVAAGEALLAELETIETRAARLVELGELPPGEGALVSLERARRTHALLRDRGLLGAGALRLRAAIGFTPTAPVTFHPALPLPETSAEQGALAARNPTLARLAEEYAVAEEALRQAVAAQVPDLTLGPLLESDAGQLRWGFLSGIGLPLWNRNRRAIAVAHADRLLARTASEAAFEELAGRLALASLQVDAAAAQRGALERDLVPLVDEALALAREGLALGEGSLVVLLEGVARAHETQLALIEARAAEALARAEVLHLTGPPEVTR